MHRIVPPFYKAFDTIFAQLLQGVLNDTDLLIAKIRNSVILKK